MITIQEVLENKNIELLFILVNGEEIIKVTKQKAQEIVNTDPRPSRVQYYKDILSDGRHNVLHQISLIRRTQ